MMCLPKRYLANLSQVSGYESKYEIRHFNESSKLDEDISGKFADLEEMIEGNTWIQTTKGVPIAKIMPTKKAESCS